ncbi:OLC1v1015133C1 [Oldenlandia corymbosa var. corymbosa]|uniref:OLC1v1015133C1 n=1 Tax=Oldenlandia corymbosa var. corymbosa TaxID=529605 RepID=A0AAV1E617_OLDCO|nr:OLC1v1015133C1 [Oldenlandia corymbosa var. corymbosa]
MSEAKAANLAKMAICIAAYNAPHYGDVFSVYKLGSDGCTKLLEEDMEEWYKENMKAPRRRYKIIGKGWSSP